MKGIILAGGTGSRLYPITKGISKQLLPIYDKPMIFYPLSVLLLAGIDDILIITTANEQANFINLLGHGEELGIKLSYAVQSKPDGIAQAFIIGKDFIGSSSVCFVLGDNIFWGHGFSQKLKLAKQRISGATVFAYQTKDPERFGIISFNQDRVAQTIEEKPIHPKSNYAVTGLYFYNNDVVEIAEKITPSERGELEITDINKHYLAKKKLNVELLGRGYAWLDTGTHESLLEASMFVETIEKRQGYKIACLEEISWRNGWLNDEQLYQISQTYLKSGYGQYLLSLLTKEKFNDSSH